MLVRAKPLLGTLVELKVQAATPALEWQAAEAAFGAIARIHSLMSFQDCESEVSRLNREAHRKAVKVTRETYDVLSRTLEFSAWSGGLFDCTVGTRLVALNYLPDIDGDAAAEDGCFRDIQLMPDHEVRFAKPLRIDLGGIAKGYAVDEAIAALSVHGVQAALVNAGGDLRAFGDRDWLLALRNPQAPAHTIPLPPIRDAAVATTADYFAARDHDGERVNPIIDPRSQRSCADAVSVSVFAPRCIDADALTKIVWLSPEPPRDLLARLDARAVVLGTSARPSFLHRTPTGNHETRCA